MGFVQTLLAKGPSTPLSRYTTMNGAFYMALGLSLFAWPQAVEVVFRGAPLLPGQEGLVRALGFTVVVIGWFYVMGGRTGAASFGLATVVDRLLVPLALLPLGLTGQVDMHLVVPFSLLDPVLGIGAYVIWRRQARAA